MNATLSGELEKAFAFAVERLRNQDPKAALMGFDQVIAMNPAIAQGWCGRGFAQLALGLLENSLNSFNQALTRDGTLNEANEALAQLLRRLPNPRRMLLVNGGVGDLLQFLPFLLDSDARKLPILLLSHFKHASQFYQRLGIEIAESHYYSNLAEAQRLQARVRGLQNLCMCPRSLFFSRSPFPPVSPPFALSRPLIGVHLGGSRLSIDEQKKRGLPTKDLPAGILQRLRSTIECNVVLFGTQLEIDTLGVVEDATLKLACFPEVIDSLALAPHCHAFVGSDSAVKTMTSMLKIPSIVWLGDYTDPFRDRAFIEPYVRAGVMKVFRYRDASKELDEGMRLALAALREFGVVPMTP